jgi:hypothetical protein
VDGHDAAVDPKDAAVAPGDAAVPDAFVPHVDGGSQIANVVGWYGYAFEHVGFVPEANVDPEQFDDCTGYVMAAEGEEDWWVSSPVQVPSLSFYPQIDGYERLGLVRVAGVLSTPGEYGHMGMYERELALTSAELLPCETARETRHCLVPPAGEYCVLPEPPNVQTRSYGLVRTVGGAYAAESLELRIRHNELIDDGETDILVAFSLSLGDGPGPDAWQAFPVESIGAVTLREIHSWLYYEEIDHPNAQAGWVLRHEGSDTYRISLDGRAADDTRLHVWGDFTVTETIYAP